MSDKPQKDQKDKESLQKEGEDIFKTIEFSNAVNLLKTNYKTYLEQIVLYNNLRKAKYDSLLKVGFTEEMTEKIILHVDLFK